MLMDVCFKSTAYHKPLEVKVNKGLGCIVSQKVSVQSEFKPRSCVLSVPGKRFLIRSTFHLHLSPKPFADMLDSEFE